jgi:hypothetical protein
MQTRSIVIFSKPYEILSMKYLWPSTGSIKPIYKNKGNPLDPKNFRPITILSCLGKLFTAILNERLRVFSEEAFLLEEQEYQLSIENHIHQTYQIGCDSKMFL